MVAGTSTVQRMGAEIQGIRATDKGAELSSRWTRKDMKRFYTTFKVNRMAAIPRRELSWPTESCMGQRRRAASSETCVLTAVEPYLLWTREARLLFYIPLAGT